jgi:hypothetical protein
MLVVTLQALARTPDAKTSLQLLKLKLKLWTLYIIQLKNSTWVLTSKRVISNTSIIYLYFMLEMATSIATQTSEYSFACYSDHYLFFFLTDVTFFAIGFTRIMLGSFHLSLSPLGITFIIKNMKRYFLLKLHSDGFSMK